MESSEATGPGLAWPGSGQNSQPAALVAPGRLSAGEEVPASKRASAEAGAVCLHTEGERSYTRQRPPSPPQPPSLLHCALGEPGEDRRVPPSPSPPSQRLFKVLFPHMWKCPWSHLFVPPFLAPSLPFFLVLPGHGVCHPTVEPPCAKGPPRWRGQREDRRAGVPPRAGGGGHTQIGARRQRLCGYSCI